MPEQDISHSPQRSKDQSRTKKNRRSKVNTLLKRATSEWGNFWARIRSLSEVVFAPDGSFDELFETSDSEGAFERLTKVSKAYTSAEEAFLQEYRKHKSLEKMYEHHQQGNDEIRSSTTMGSESPVGQDVGLLILKRIGSDNQEVGSTAVESTNYDELDVCKLREQMEQDKQEPMSSGDCLGEKLWKYRRNMWLTPTKNEEDIEDHIVEQSLSHLPREALPKVYTNLVDRGRVLRQDRYVNLEDLTKIINAGWIAEEKWERAAKGLP